MGGDYLLLRQQQQRLLDPSQSHNVDFFKYLRSCQSNLMIFVCYTFSRFVFVATISEVTIGEGISGRGFNISVRQVHGRVSEKISCRSHQKLRNYFQRNAKTKTRLIAQAKKFLWPLLLEIN